MFEPSSTLTLGPDEASSPSIWRARGSQGHRIRCGGTRSSQHRDTSRSNTEPESSEQILITLLKSGQK